MTVTTGSKSNTAPLVLSVLISRTVLLVLVYFITAWLLKSLNIPAPYDSARAWWPLGLIVVNGIVLFVLFFAVKRQGVTLSSLIGFDKSMFRKDLVSSFWIIPVSILLMVGATMGSSILLYGDNAPSGLMSLSSLPVWAMILSLIFHPLINAFVEEMTYNGYVFPRLSGLLRSSWLSVILVTFFFALQHIAIPFALDAKFVLWRFLSFAPLALFWVLTYAKMRRLTALIIVHWFMDIFGVLYSVLLLPSP